MFRIWMLPFLSTLISLSLSIMSRDHGDMIDATYWAILATPMALIALVTAIVDVKE